MSRWNKGRVQTYALPLDALVKEKENTNRPVAARSAGTVGKWGITSFTSIRGPAYGNLFCYLMSRSMHIYLFVTKLLGYSSFSPKQEQTHQSISLQSGDTTTQLAQPTNAPKPKKFFKSRNIVPATGNLTPPTQVDPIQQNAVPKISLKVNKKLPNTSDEIRKTKAEKTVKPKKVKKQKDETKLSVEKPTRVLSRTRKAVNYLEDRSRSPTPNYAAGVAGLLNRLSDEVEPSTVVDVKSLSTENASTTNDAIPTGDDSKNVTHDHPPIVLRISKVRQSCLFLFYNVHLKECINFIKTSFVSGSFSIVKQCD